MRRQATLISSIVLALSLTACVSSGPKVVDAQAGDVSIMADNVENLFDTVHDQGTEDFTYLPLAEKHKPEIQAGCAKVSSKRYRQECYESDWNETILERKMRRLADVILQVNSGRGPDLLMLEEVENIRVLKKLNDEFLQAAGYTHVIHIEGPDKRGIDSAMLSRLNLIGEPKLHKIPFKAKDPKDQEWMDRSRGILEANWELPDGQKLRAFGVHLPSPTNPSYWRAQAIDFLNELRLKTPAEYLTLAAGDFNISASDEKENKFYRERISQHWRVSHLIGCQHCIGTNYFHQLRQWSFLDAIVFDPRMADGQASWRVLPESIRTPNNSKFQKNQYASPARFDEESPVGVSDHYPIYAIIRRNTTLEAKN